MAKARRRRIWSGSRDCLANVRRAAASKSGRRGTGAAMTILEQTWPPRNHTHAPRTTPAHETHFRGVGISSVSAMVGLCSHRQIRSSTSGHRSHLPLLDPPTGPQGKPGLVDEARFVPAPLAEAELVARPTPDPSTQGCAVAL